MSDLVWYSTYGSNLYSKRLLCYIKGGKIEGLTRDHYGSQDKSDPVNNGFIHIPYKLFFSQKVSFWQSQGVAFLQHQPSDAKTISRIWLINKAQFKDILAQENSTNPANFNIQVPYGMEEQSFQDIGGNHEFNWYGRILRMKDYQGYPMYSFTTKIWTTENDLVSPGRNYIGVIMKGILDSGKPEEEVKAYMLSQLGIRGMVDPSKVDEALEFARTLE